MKILLGIESSEGGAARHLVDLANGLIARDHNVTVVYSPMRTEPSFMSAMAALPEGTVKPVPISRSIGISDVGSWLALQQLTDNHYDIVHGHSSKAGALLRGSRVGKARRVYTPHAFATMDMTRGKASRVFYRGIEVLLSRVATDAVIAVSEAEYQHALGIGIPRDKLHLVINGIPPVAAESREKARAKLNIDPKRWTIGFVGRLSHQKAPERLVESFARVAQDMPDAQVVMLGHGEGKAALIDLIAARGLSDRVHVRSGLSGAPLMTAFDVLVMPSRYEAMPYVLIEGLSARLPIIISDVSVDEAVENGVNGIVVPNNDDPQPLAAALCTLKGNPKIAARMAEASAERFAHFTADAMVSRTEAVYRSVLGWA
ncbi:glycosyltransferase [Caulobacter sp. 602-1]|uniref:glycosyltransferase n=1 Tax=Caulobacter sp. 602-1 TaxID=2492472 RepID=UPI000F63FA48|nr:glycosyltransferase [Caulobacter sp. 602-1]RRN62198.1 glycosyltransferase family 1 protein [Caulobacter sp. 602-1]